jgi:hypothetical protein
MGKIVKMNKNAVTVKKKYKKPKRNWTETNEVVEWRENKTKENQNTSQQ